MKKNIIATLFILLNLPLAYSETLKVALNLPNVPFSYYDENYQIAGLDVDLIQAVAKEENLEIEFIPATFPRVFDELNNKQVDIIGNVYHSEEREANFTLSNPYYIDPIEFLAQKGKANENFLNEVSQISVISYSPLEALLKEMQNEYKLTIKPADTSFLAFREMMSGENNLFLTTQATTIYFKEKYPQYEYEILSVPKAYKQEIALVWLMRKNDQELAEKINQGLEKIKNSGEYEAIKQKYNIE